MDSKYSHGANPMRSLLYQSVMLSALMLQVWGEDRPCLSGRESIGPDS